MAGVVAVLFLGAMTYLGHGTGRLGKRLFEARVQVAVATDAIPGSSPVHTLLLMAAVAVTQMSLTTDQAVRAMSRGAASALRRTDIGHFDVRAAGRFLVLNSRDSLALVSSFGEPIIRDFVEVR